MIASLLKALNIEVREAGSVFLLIFQSFFIGIFFATLENSASALFMSQYGEEMLGQAYLLSGGVGILLTGLYSRLQSSISFSKLAIANLLFIVISTYLMWYSFDFSNSKWLVFGIFILMGPLNILALVGFSGMAGRMFTLRQGKRLFSIIDSGLVFGMILISLAIPIILRFIPGPEDLILISAGSITVSLLLQFIITSKYNLNVTAESSNRPSEIKGAGVRTFVTNRYIRLMSLFVILSMITIFFTSYNFLTVARINYPETKDFAAFFAKFTVAVMAFSFIIKTFIYSKLMKTYGLKLSLLVVPCLIGLFAFVAAVVGTAFGSEKGTASFLIFFLLITLVRFFSINLKDSIQNPSLKLLFQPIDASIRYNIQAKVEGVINEFSAVFSGLILTLLAGLTFFELINYSHVLIVIIVAWIYVTVQLYKEYQNTLKQSLVNYQKKKSIEKEKKEEGTAVNLDETHLFDKITESLDLLKRFAPTEFDLKLSELLSTNSIEVKELAIKSIDELEVYGSISELKELAEAEKDPRLKQLATDVRVKLEKAFKSNITDDNVVALSKSKVIEDRIQAAKIIGDLGDADYSNLLKNLLKDLEPAVKLQAINAVTKVNNPELWPVLVEQLADPNYRAAAHSALLAIGSHALAFLEKSFYKSGSSAELLVEITTLYGKIGGDRAQKYLLKKLNYPLRKVVLEALKSLGELNFSTTDEHILNQIFDAIEQHAGIASWNLAAKHDLQQLNVKNFMLEAMDDEIDENFNLIFMLLSLAYDPQSIQHIRENIESGTTEGVSFAIEMLDLFVDERLKQILFPLFEDNRLEEKIRELELHFPINLYGDNRVLNHITGRNSNFLSSYTRACALYSFLDLEEQAINNDIVANLFNPDPLLRETAAVVIYTMDRSMFDQCLERLEEDVQDQLMGALKAMKSGAHELLIEKAMFLNESGLFKGQKSVGLIEDLGLHMRHRTFTSNAVIMEAHDTSETEYFILSSGLCELESGGNSQSLKNGQLYSNLIFDSESNGQSRVMARSEVECYVISQESMNELVFKFPSLADLLISVIDLRQSEHKLG